MVKPSPFDIYELEYRVVRARNRLYFRVAPKDDPERPKIFVLGHPRTGTGSIHRILLDNGIHAVHTPGGWKTDRFDAFSDRGNYQPFDLFDAYYRNSCFVLNTRPAVNYLRSRMHQTSRRRRNRRQPRPRFTAANIRNELLRRNAHFYAVARHFHGRDSLVVVNIERPGALAFLCDRLGLDYGDEVWRNRAGKPMDANMADNVDRAFESLGAGGDKDNPFIIRGLLDADERHTLDGFMAANRDRIYL